MPFHNNTRQANLLGRYLVYLGALFQSIVAVMKESVLRCMVSVASSVLWPLIGAVSPLVSCLIEQVWSLCLCRRRSPAPAPIHCLVGSDLLWPADTRSYYNPPWPPWPTCHLALETAELTSNWPDIAFRKALKPKTHSNDTTVLSIFFCMLYGVVFWCIYTSYSYFCTATAAHWHWWSW